MELSAMRPCVTVATVRGTYVRYGTGQLCVPSHDGPMCFRVVVVMKSRQLRCCHLIEPQWKFPVELLNVIRR